MNKICVKVSIDCLKGEQMSKKEKSKKFGNRKKESLRDDEKCILTNYFHFKPNILDIVLFIIGILWVFISKNEYLLIFLFFVFSNFIAGLFFSLDQVTYNNEKGSKHFKYVSKFNYLTALEIFIWLVFFGVSLIITVGQLSKTDPDNVQYHVFSTEALFLISIIPFWYKYERYCVLELKKASKEKEIAVFNAKSLRFMLIAIAALCVISVNIFAVSSRSFAFGTDPEDLQLVTNISCIAGGLATVLYPIIDMFIYIRKIL